MIKLSVIIVNYNVQYFLEQALLSALKAAERVPTEIWVVDNNSVDNSVEMVRSKFPHVHLIANKKNVGFSTANNQAIAQSSGEYVLLLNPDTVVREDTFEKTVAFMDAHPDAGGLGVKMIDGRGNFLPESKRGFPSPSVAFYKTFGLSKLFPKSERFNRYHLGYLSNDETHEVDVLSGAFMLLRTSVLNKIGYLDEAFFMYGEDIDLSYRIVQAGYKNYYFADTTIIHYKGESTKKGSLNYVRTFYQAMIIFTEKHFQASGARLFVLMLRLAIYFRASITLVSNTLRAVYQPLLDASIIFAGLYVLQNFWATARFDDANYFPDTLLYINFPLYIIVWLSCVYIQGGYDRGNRFAPMLSGVAVGTLLVAAIYGFLPMDLRYSRVLIVLGMLWAMVGMGLIRILQNIIRHKTFFYNNLHNRNIIIIGNKAESERVLSLLHRVQLDMNFIGTVAPSEDTSDYAHYLGGLHQLSEIVHIYKVNEIIFCGVDLSTEQIIGFMTNLGEAIHYKIVPAHSGSIIGSNSKDTAGDLYTIDISFAIAQPTNRRYKRLLDILTSIFIILLFPLFAILAKSGWQLLKNTLLVLTSKRTWVGYHAADTLLRNFPKLPPAVLTPLDILQIQPSRPETLHRLHLFYAKDYAVDTDINIIGRNLHNLGRSAPKPLVWAAGSSKTPE